MPMLNEPRETQERLLGQDNVTLIVWARGSDKPSAKSGGQRGGGIQVMSGQPDSPHAKIK
jgi:hypothetical protein